MITKKVKIGAAEYEIRQLTWGEKKKLKADGVLARVTDPKADNDVDIEQIISMCCPQQPDVDDMPAADVLELFSMIFEFSFVGSKAAKNSVGRPS